MVKGNLLSYVLIILVCISLILTGVQTYQISEVKEKISTGALDVSNSANAGEIIGNKIANSPVMVGGC